MRCQIQSASAFAGSLVVVVGWSMGLAAAQAVPIVINLSAQNNASLSAVGCRDRRGRSTTTITVFARKPRHSRNDAERWMGLFDTTPETGDRRENQY